MDLTFRRKLIGNKIRELRESESWNQVRLGIELANVIGKPAPVSSATISRYEEGKRSVKPEVLEALAGIFKVKASIFYENDSNFSERRAEAGTGTNTKRLTVIEDLPLSFPEHSDRDIAGFAEFPRFLFPGAEFIIKIGEGFSCEGAIDEGDYIVVVPDSGQISSDKIFYKLEGIFFVGRPPNNPTNAEIIGKVVSVLKKY